MDESLIRQLWILKIYQDVVLDRRWRRSFDPGTILLARNEADIDKESIGFLTSLGTIPAWESEFRSRYAFTGSIVMPGPPRTVLSARRSRYGSPPVMVMTRPSADCQCCPADSGACFERVFTTSPTPGDAVRDRPSGS